METAVTQENQPKIPVEFIPEPHRSEIGKGFAELLAATEDYARALEDYEKDLENKVAAW